MGKCIYYLATSLDGFLADENGGVEWLDEFNHEGFDYGYADFYKKIGFIITGSKTYEQAKDFPGGWAFPNTETYIFSSREINTEDRSDIQVWNGSVEEINDFLSNKNKDTWLIGGANLAAQFVNAGLLDELIITVIPVLLGKGKPMFDGLKHHVNLKHISKEVFPNGVVQLIYNLK